MNYALRLHCVQNELLQLDSSQVERRNLRQGVAAGLLLNYCAGAGCQHLTGEGWVVDLHSELETLVLSLAAHALAFEEDAVSHIAEVVDVGHLVYVRVVVAEVRI